MVTYRVLLLSVLSVVFLAPVVLPVSSALEQTVPADGAQAAASAEAPVQPPAPAVSVPSNDVLLMLIRTSLIALNQANQTGNYSTLRDIGSPALQANNTPATLAVAFTKLREQNVDLSPVAVISPQLTEPAAITPQGLLNVTGVFPTQPMAIKFQTVYQPVNGKWRLFGLSVDTVAPQPAPMAAAEPVTPAAPAKKKAKKVVAAPAAAPAP